MLKLWTASFQCRNVATKLQNAWPSRPLSTKGFKDPRGPKTFSEIITKESRFTGDRKAVKDSKVASRKEEVLSRTTIVTDENVCSKIVGSILRLGEPVAVDMEVKTFLLTT